MTTTKKLVETNNSPLGLTDNQRRLELAKGTKRISGSLDRDILIALATSMELVGLKDLPSETSKLLLLTTVKREYFNLHLDEIILAYQMAVVGKLDIDSKHYQNFSSQYFCNIINAYQEWKRKEQLKINKGQGNQLKMIETPKDTPETCYNSLKNRFGSVTDDCLLGNYNDAFEYAWKEELITLTDKEKKNWKSRVVKMLNKQSKESKTNSTAGKIIKKMLSSESDINKQCRKYILLHHFKKIS